MLITQIEQIANFISKPLFNKTYPTLSDSIKSFIERVSVTLGCLFVRNLLNPVQLPGTNVNFIETTEESTNFLAALNKYGGGYTVNSSIMFLGIGPYISASIIMQVLFSLYPALKEKRKDSPSIVNEWTRLLSIPITLLQGSINIVEIVSKNQDLSEFSIIEINPLIYAVTGVLSLMAGCYISLFLSDIITSYGLGNGTAVLICDSILERLASELNSIAILPYGYLVLLLSVLCVGTFIIIVELSFLNVPVLFPHSISNTSRSIEKGKAFIPFKINQNGVMAPIVVQNFILIVRTIVSKLSGLPWFSFLDTLSVSDEFMLLCSSFMIVFISFVLLEINVNVDDISKSLHEYTFCVIKGSQPGDSTKIFVSTLTQRLCVLGAAYVVLLHGLPRLVGSLFLGGFSVRFVGTELLLILGTFIDIFNTSQTYFYNTNIIKE